MGWYVVKENENRKQDTDEFISSKCEFAALTI